MISYKKNMVKVDQATKVTTKTQVPVLISVGIMMIGALAIALGFSLPLLREEPSGNIPEPAYERTVPTHFELAVAYAPTWYQDTHSDVWSDMMVAFNFDGDYVGNNNWGNQGCCAPYAYVYYYVIETDTHWFIIYPEFHAKDVAEPFCTDLTCHENDMEGAMIVVRKAEGNPYGEIEYVETRFHMDLLKYYASNIPKDISDPNQRRVNLFIEAKGHGVKNDPSVTSSPTGNFPGGDGYIYRYTGTAERSDYYDDSDPDNRTVGYALLSYEEEFWSRRDTGYGSGYMYDTPFVYNGSRFSLPGLIPGALDGDNYGDDKANPAWAWDEDGDVPVKGDWGIDPAYTIQQHFSPAGDFSLEYTSNFFFNCDDGTAHGSCNPVTHRYCSYQQLAPCPNETQCNPTTLTCDQTCSDGTTFDTCSENPPQYCGATDVATPDPSMPRMVCLFRTGQQGGENDACQVVALASDPKPIYSRLTDDDWRKGRDPYIESTPMGQFSGRYLCDPDQAGGQCARDCWNIIGTNSNNSGGNDGLDDIFCAPNSGCSPVSFSGCPSENPSCITNAKLALEDVYHKVVYYHWVADRGGTRWRQCNDDDGDQSYAIGIGIMPAHCAVARCDAPEPGDIYDGFDLLWGLVVLESDFVPVSRIADYEIRDECLLCGCPGSAPYCNIDTASCEEKCADGTEYGQCNSSNQYCNNGELLPYQCGYCGVTCPSGYSCDGGRCCRKVGGSYECNRPTQPAQALQ